MRDRTGGGATSWRLATISGLCLGMLNACDASMDSAAATATSGVNAVGYTWDWPYASLTISSPYVPTGTPSVQTVGATNFNFSLVPKNVNGVQKVITGIFAAVYHHEPVSHVDTDYFYRLYWLHGVNSIRSPRLFCVFGGEEAPGCRSWNGEPSDPPPFPTGGGGIGSAGIHPDGNPGPGKSLIRPASSVRLFTSAAVPQDGGPAEGGPDQSGPGGAGDAMQATASADPGNEPTGAKQGAPAADSTLQLTSHVCRVPPLPGANFYLQVSFLIDGFDYTVSVPFSLEIDCRNLLQFLPGIFR